MNLNAINTYRVLQIENITLIVYYKSVKTGVKTGIYGYWL